MFPTFEIFGRTIGMYGVCAVIGLFVCFFVSRSAIKKYGISDEDMILVIVAAGIGLLIGGHLLYGVTNAETLAKLVRALPKLKAKTVLDILVYCFGGAVFYGGFLGGLAGIFVYTGINRKLDRKTALDVYAFSTPLFHVFGRIGCFFAGCCYGIESDFGFTVHGNTLNPAINDVKRLPVPLIEAACNLVIFFVLFSIFKKEKLRGRLIFLYMLIYSAVRFADEFFRGDEIRGFLFGLSTSQWISIALFGISVVYFVSSAIKREKSRTASQL